MARSSLGSSKTWVKSGLIGRKGEGEEREKKKKERKKKEKKDCSGLSGFQNPNIYLFQIFETRFRFYAI